MIEINRQIRNQAKFVSMQLRAYIFPNDGLIIDGMIIDSPQPSRANTPGIIINFRNSGNTPAYKLISWADISVIETRLEHTLTVPILEARNQIHLVPARPCQKPCGMEEVLARLKLPMSEPGRAQSMPTDVWNILISSISQDIPISVSAILGYSLLQRELFSNIARQEMRQASAPSAAANTAATLNY